MNPWSLDCEAHLQIVEQSHNPIKNEPKAPDTNVTAIQRCVRVFATFIKREIAMHTI